MTVGREASKIWFYTDPIISVEFLKNEIEFSFLKMTWRELLNYFFKK